MNSRTRVDRQEKSMMNPISASQFVTTFLTDWSYSGFLPATADFWRTKFLTFSSPITSNSSPTVNSKGKVLSLRC